MPRIYVLSWDQHRGGPTTCKCSTEVSELLVHCDTLMHYATRFRSAVQRFSGGVGRGGRPAAYVFEPGGTAAERRVRCVSTAAERGSIGRADSRATYQRVAQLSPMANTGGIPGALRAEPTRHPAHFGAFARGRADGDRDAFARNPCARLS